MDEPVDLEKPDISQEQFLEWRTPQFGTANPTAMGNPLWEWLMRTRMNAYQANEAWCGPSSFDAGPMWCFDRFGQSTTQLPDGRILYVAGEHEDHYDPDFFIYNDVVVAHPDGAISIYGYPKDVFPPTDFHTATLLSDRIILIGNLGNSVDWAGKTQVLELSLDTLAVRKIETHGDSPGWISCHSAALSTAGNAIVVNGGQVYNDTETGPWENVDKWDLDLASWAWTRKTRRDWQQWMFIRADHKRNLIWDIRHALWMRGVGWKEDLAKAMQRMVDQTGFEPDLDLVNSLYLPDATVTELPRPEDDDGYNVVRVMVDGVIVRFTEDGFTIRAVAEGPLAEARLKALQESVLEKLSRLHGVSWLVHAMA
jgi:hypothetical protein